MGYVRSSTNNPLGRKPWNAMLQPGGLGAFPPNAEAIGSPSVMIDRDAANPCGWKGASWAGAPVPRIYYPPDARLQYVTPRAQGLGRVGRLGTPITTMVPGNPSIISRLWGNNPIVAGPFIPANTIPQNPSTSNVSTSPAAPTTPVYNTMPATVQVSLPSGATVTQSTSSGSTAAQVSGTPVPVGQPVASPYTDSSGNVWLFSGSTWYNASAQVAGTPVPVGTSTTSTYTDSSGNVWTFNGTVWASPTAASSSASILSGSWWSENTIVSAVPNWVIIGGAAFALWMFTKKK